MVLHRYSSFIFLFLVFPSIIWSVALPLGPGHWCHFSKGGSFNKDAGKSIKKSKMFHFSLQCWQNGRDQQDSGGWDRLMVICHLSLCKMCVSLDDPALVVPWMGAADQILSPILVQNVCHLWWPCPCGSLDGTSWPDFWWFILSEISSGKWNGQ